VVGRGGEHRHQSPFTYIPIPAGLICRPATVPHSFISLPFQFCYCAFQFSQIPPPLSIQFNKHPVNRPFMRHRLLLLMQSNLPASSLLVELNSCRGD
jgi:hypothetical protein